ncbi:MFS transporter [Pararhodobacter marinus]|uniref:MFS transporter n=1 Tax=Pararhodobacter marinus TaxID=2184063 RepID=A0A2U2C3T2_9RHOB|nr:MFS transporter [Pararhodobacter marinus]PWE26546.1 MFS transporter [Pararhodobacter marinus]
MPLPSALTRFIAASGLTNLGDGIATIAWAWTASLLTRDPLLIALVPVALRLPWAVFALPAGVITDRTDRRRLILAMDAARMLAFLAAALALWASLPLPDAPETGTSAPMAFAALMLAALVVGVAEVFRDNAAQTMLPSLVPHARLEAANGRLWSVELAGNALIGPPLGALLIGLALPLPFIANAATYGTAALIVAGLAGTYRAERPGPRSFRAELAEGLAFLRGSELLRMLAVLTGLWNLFFMMGSIALVLHVQENLGLSSTAYGLILAAGAVGGITGGLMGEAVVHRLGPARTAQLTLAVSPPAFLLFALAPGPWSLALVLAVFDWAGFVWNTVSVATRQRMIPDALLGRVNSAYRLLAWGMMPLGLLLSGLLVRLTDGPLPRGLALTTPFLAAALGSVAVVLWGWGPLGRLLARKPARV